MNKTKTALFSVAIVGAAVGVNTLLDATKPEPEKKEEEIRPISLFVEPVVEQSVVLYVESQGEVRAHTDIDLVSQVSGRVVRVADEFIEGGLVEPGATLLWIDDSDYQLAVTSAEARVAEAQVRVETALADADVARKQLRNSRNPSALALKKPQVAEAKAKLKAAEADLALAQLNLERTRITVPFDGRVASRKVSVGDFISVGTQLGRAFATDKVQVRIPINDSQLASLGLPIGYNANNDAPEVQLSARVAGETRQWQGRLISVDAAIDPATRMLFAVAEVEDPYGAAAATELAGGQPLAVGLYVDAKIAGRNIDSARMISRIALQPDNSVYVIEAEGTLDIREVKVVHKNSEDVVVAAGLDAGEQVVVSPVRNPIKGMRVEALSSEEPEPEVIVAGGGGGDGAIANNKRG